MLQMLMALAVLFAALALLVASHRVGHRLFVRVAAVVAVVAAVVFGTLLFQYLRPPLLADPGVVDVQVTAAHRVEVGYRVEFVARNAGDGNTRQVAFEIALSGCLELADAGTCTDWDSVSVDMPLHVPPQGSYPFAQLLEFKPLPDNLKPAWDVTVTRVRLYR